MKIDNTVTLSHRLRLWIGTYLYLQMILERRTNQGMLRLTQLKDEGGVSSEDKTKGKEKVDRGPVTANVGQNGETKARTQHETTDETDQQLSHAGIGKPGLVSTPPAVDKMNPLAKPDLGKLTYNPITHAASMSEHQYLELASTMWSDFLCC